MGGGGLYSCLASGMLFMLWLHRMYTPVLWIDVSLPVVSEHLVTCLMLTCQMWVCPVITEAWVSCLPFHRHSLGRLAEGGGAYVYRRKVSL